jgi:hypothetical protein
LGRVKYTPSLVAYVSAATVLALLIAVWTVRPPGDVLTLATGAAIVFLMALYAVRLPAVQTHWTPSIFVQLGLSFTLGPAGAASAALAEGLGGGIRETIE